MRDGEAVAISPGRTLSWGVRLAFVGLLSACGGAFADEAPAATGRATALRGQGSPAEEARRAEAWLASLEVDQIPAALARLLGARRGSPDARLGHALMARWSSVTVRRRAASLPQLEAEILALDVRSAARLAAMLPILDGSEEPLTEAVQRWVRTDARACAEWVASRRPGPVRDAAFGAFAGAIDDLAPGDAAAWAAELPDGELKERTLSAALARWSEESPADAAQWAQTNLEGAARARAAGAAAQSWGRQDARAAMQWASDQAGDAGLRDAVRIGLAQSLAARRPEEAVAHAASVASSRDRQRLLQATLKHWHAPLEAGPQQAGTPPTR